MNAYDSEEWERGGGGRDLNFPYALMIPRSRSTVNNLGHL